MADSSPTPRSEQKQEIHLTLTSDQCDQALVCLAEAAKRSQQQVKQAMQKGALWLTRGKKTQRLRRMQRTLKPDDQLHLYYDEKVLAQAPPAAVLLVDEGEYSVWIKPCGMVSQGSKWGDHCTINRWAEQHLNPQRNAFIVHRLDRATTGLMLIAHSKSAAQALSAAFAARTVKKTYHALVQGRCDFELRTLDQPVNAKPAISHFTCVDYDAITDQSFLRVQIETGRKHQIRQHLASLGHPVIGDRLYGKPSEEDSLIALPDLQLFASDLAFVCPLTHLPKTFSLPEEWLPQRTK